MLASIGRQFKKPEGFGGRIISLLMKKGNSFAYDILLEKMQIKDNDQLFEIGYGHGLGIKRILSSTACKVDGIDFSELMYREASRRNKNEINQGKANLAFGDFLEYNLPDNTYDNIFCINVIYFWKELETPFSNIIKGLKTGGEFYFFMASRENLDKLKFTKDYIFNKYEIDAVVEKLKSVGFAKVEYEHNNGYFVECVK